MLAARSPPPTRKCGALPVPELYSPGHRDKSNPHERPGPQVISIPGEKDQFLIALGLTYRQNHSSPDSQLINQTIWDLGSRSRDDDPIKSSLVGQTKRTVTEMTD